MHWTALILPSAFEINIRKNTWFIKLKLFEYVKNAQIKSNFPDVIAFDALSYSTEKKIYIPYSILIQTIQK